MAGLIAEDRILWPKKAGGRPRLKRYISDMQTVTTGFSTVLDAPGNVDATKELGEIMGPKAFAFPKPSELIALLIDQCTQRGDLVLDSFVGSGTTGHAVLRLNHQDDGNRRFVLVEMEPKIAREISAERIKRVAQGYTNAKGEAVSGLGGGFRYCRLDKPLFDEQGRISAEVKFVDLAAHVFFTETGSPIPKQASARSSLLGRARGTAYYLLFNGVLGDKTPDGGNVLTAKVLAGLATHNGPKVIFGEGCRLSDARLKREQITFKQLPYEIKVS
jgi:site-specific DNA-methyltransferase (adenine-specific)/adenine-specific DNA-methyltransferase